MIDSKAYQGGSILTDYQTRRKFITSAIYVEKSISSTTTASSDCSSIKSKTSDRDFTNSELLTPAIKVCSCSVNPQHCPCHPKNPNVFCQSTGKVGHQNSTCKSALNSVRDNNKPKVLVSTLTAMDDETSLNMAKNEILRKWMERKEKEKKEKQQKEIMLKKAIREQKEKVVNQQRKNFEKWLADKRKSELAAKKEKEKQKEDLELKELEREKKILENELSFHMWVKKKEEETLEKKIKEQVKVINDLEKKQKQLEHNEKSYKEWIKNSKNKPTPAPFGKGLKSLCSSSSVTYVNPIPWRPNLEDNKTTN